MNRSFWIGPKSNSTNAHFFVMTRQAVYAERDLEGYFDEEKWVSN